MTVTYHHAPQGSDEWLAARVGLLTASDFKAALSNGTQRQTLIDTLAAERITGKMDTDGWQSGWMARGIELEPQARACYEIETGHEASEVGLATNDRYPGIGASLDGLIGSDRAVEIKCPKASTVVRYHRQGKLPAEYRQQVHGQMLVCELAAVDFYAWNPALPPFRMTIRRHEKLLAEMADQLAAVVADIEKLVEEIRG